MKSITHFFLAVMAFAIVLLNSTVTARANSRRILIPSLSPVYGGSPWTERMWA